MEECEEVVDVAKRNVEGLIREVIINQQEKADLARMLEAEEAAVKRQEEEENHLLLTEVGKITRNIILLQTRLMILEEKRFERDKLFLDISEAENNMTLQDKYHENELQKAHAETRMKYEKLSDVLNERMMLVSQCSGRLGCAQQVAALRERGLRILATQARLRKVEGLMLDLHRQNKEMREEVRLLKKKVEAAAKVSAAVSEEVKVAEKYLETFVQFLDDEEDPHPIEQLEPKLNSIILEMETKIFEMNDKREHLEQTVADQECHLKSMEEEEKKRKQMQRRLLGMSHVAELVMGDNPPVEKHTHESLSERSTFLTEMSTIMLENTTDCKNINEFHQREVESIDGFPYIKGFLGLVPEKGSTQSKLHSPSSFVSLEVKQMDEDKPLLLTMK